MNVFRNFIAGGAVKISKSSDGGNGRPPSRTKIVFKQGINPRSELR